MEINKKALRIAAYVAAGFIALLIIFFVLRTPLLKLAVSRVESKFEKRYGGKLIVDGARFSGLTTVKLDQFAVVPPWGDTLVNIHEMSVGINPLKLLAGRISLTSLHASAWSVNMQRTDSLTNYMFLFRKDKKDEDSTEQTATPNYNKRISMLIKAVFDIVPPDVDVAEFKMSSVNNDHLFKMQITPLKISGGDINLTSIIEEDNTTRHLKFVGSIGTWSKNADIQVFSPEGKMKVPYISYRFNADVAFDTLRFKIYDASWKSDVFALKGLASFDGLEINHKRISTTNVVFGKGSLAYSLNAGSNFLELDSTSVVTFNRLQFNPYLKVTKDGAWKVKFEIRKNHFPAQDLFGSLPDGIFSTLHGIETDGFLNYYIVFDVDFAHPENLVFDQGLRGDHFHIKHFGNVNYTYINAPFSYTAYEYGRPVRTFEVGPSNPNFRTIDQIPDVLKDAVMTSEDGAFFSHRGFLIDAFRSSIIKDIQTKRFARGGSTITMQLVKNLFLTRNKTVSRKVEEALIVWLIENNGLCSKSRMYEIYLNIIEWGPMVYGANEASHFYFNKDVSKLTLPEAIYLASIVPHPKAFKYSFDATGNLRDFLKGYYQLISRKLLGRERITQEQYDQLVPNVNLTGPARNLVVRDSVSMDSLVMFRAPEDDFIIPSGE